MGYHESHRRATLHLVYKSLFNVQGPTEQQNTHIPRYIPEVLGIVHTLCQILAVPAGRQQRGKVAAQKRHQQVPQEDKSSPREATEGGQGKSKATGPRTCWQSICFKSHNSSIARPKSQLL